MTSRVATVLKPHTRDLGGFQVQRIAERLDELRFSKSRHAFEQRMAAGENRHQDVVDDIAVTHDDLGNFSLKQANSRSQLIEHRGGILLDDGRRRQGRGKRGFVERILGRG